MSALSDNQKREVISLGNEMFTPLGNWLFDGGNAIDQLSGFLLFDFGDSTTITYITIDFGGA